MVMKTSGLQLRRDILKKFSAGIDRWLIVLVLGLSPMVSGAASCCISCGGTTVCGCSVSRACGSCTATNCGDKGDLASDSNFSLRRSRGNFESAKNFDFGDNQWVVCEVTVTDQVQEARPESPERNKIVLEELPRAPLEPEREKG